MAKYTAGFKDKVKEDYIGGKYKTIADLARAHKITNTKLISRWRKADDWDTQFEVIKKKKEEVNPTQNGGREIAEFREISSVHGTLWKAIVAQIASRFKRRDDGTIPRLTEQQLESLSRILLRAMEGQRKALGIDDPAMADTAITINYPGLVELCRDPEIFREGKDTVVDITPSGDIGRVE